MMDLRLVNRLACGWFCGALSACAPSVEPAPPAPPPPPPAASSSIAPTATAVPKSDPTPAPEPPKPSGEQSPRSAICPGGQYAETPVDTTQATLVKEGFVFVEGPVWSDRLGALLFSEMNFNANGPNGPPSKIHLLTPDRKLFPFLVDSGSNGLAIDPKGLVAATHDNQGLSRIDLDTKERSPIVANVGGKKFNSPNDLAIGSAGDIYFTDPDWQLGPRKSETGVTGVYWVKPDLSVTLVDGGLNKPNGVSLSPDEKTLYVGDLDGNVWSYAIKNGKPGNRKLFAKVAGPDGMAMDCAGNLYVASHDAGKVQVFSRQGKPLATIDVAPKTTNAAFGGPGRKTLYVTAGTGVYALETLVPGFPY